MKRHTEVISVMFLALTLCACETERYASNIRRTYVTPWTHLSPPERDELVRLISETTRQPIQGITVWAPGSREVAVYTGFTDASTEINPWTEFKLEKRSSHWRIVSHDIISTGMATILLTTPPDNRAAGVSR
jgi:hypothetical protein